jgi:hypothetical protein
LPVPLVASAVARALPLLLLILVSWLARRLRANPG